MESMWLMITHWCNENQGFLSAILSFLAITIAISAPATIAKRQDKIALFEKRYSTLMMINKTIRFADAIRREFDSNDNISNVRLLELFVANQRIDFCLTETVSFIPNTIAEQAYEREDPDQDEIMHDGEVMRAQALKDVDVLYMGSPLFIEPVRTELENLKVAYGMYILALISTYCGIHYDANINEMCASFLGECTKFSEKSPIMKKIINEIVI